MVADGSLVPAAHCIGALHQRSAAKAQIRLTMTSLGPGAYTNFGVS